VPRRGAAAASGGGGGGSGGRRRCTFGEHERGRQQGEGVALAEGEAAGVDCNGARPIAELASSGARRVALKNRG